MNNSIFTPQPKHNGASLHGGFAAASGLHSRQLENRFYGFKELAVLYFPNIAPASASIRLKQWIKDSPELLESLDKTHYNPTARILSPMQTGLIAEVFGSPF